MRKYLFIILDCLFLFVAVIQITKTDLYFEIKKYKDDYAIQQIGGYKPLIKE